MSLALVSSAAAGVAVMNALHLASEVPTARSAWGWKMSAPADADFTCAEGEVGCESMPPACGQANGCCASNFDCTVTPKTGKTCDVSTIALKCSKNGGAGEQPNDIMCINIGYDGVPADSTLSWSATPVCQEASGTSPAASAAAAGSANRMAAVGISSIFCVVAGGLLV